MYSSVVCAGVDVVSAVGADEDCVSLFTTSRQAVNLTWLLWLRICWDTRHNCG